LAHGLHDGAKLASGFGQAVLGDASYNAADIFDTPRLNSVNRVDLAIISRTSTSVQRVENFGGHRDRASGRTVFVD
jgi:hypothetical protein